MAVMGSLDRKTGDFPTFRALSEDGMHHRRVHFAKRAWLRIFC